jgi:hypothetical protein
MMITEAQSNEMQALLAQINLEYRIATEPFENEHSEYVKILHEDFRETFTLEVIQKKCLASQMNLYEVMDVARKLRDDNVIATRKLFFPDDYPGWVPGMPNGWDLLS